MTGLSACILFFIHRLISDDIHPCETDPMSRANAVPTTRKISKSDPMTHIRGQLHYPRSSRALRYASK